MKTYTQKRKDFFGTKIKSSRNIKNWTLPYQLGFGIQTEREQKEWVDAVVIIFTHIPFLIIYKC